MGYRDAVQRAVEKKAFAPAGVEDVEDDEVPDEEAVKDEEAHKKAHGPSFWEGAARINAVMGPDFVTEEAVLLRLPARGGGNKLVPVIAVGGLVLLATVLLRRKLRSNVQNSLVPRGPASGDQDTMQVRGVPRTMSMPMQQERLPQPRRENERGSYGK